MWFMRCRSARLASLEIDMSKSAFFRSFEQVSGASLGNRVSGIKGRIQARNGEKTPVNRFNHRYLKIWAQSKARTRQSWCCIGPLENIDMSFWSAWSDINPIFGH